MKMRRSAFLLENVVVEVLLLDRPGQTYADQELLLIFTESRGPPHILIF
jgi:hypothetical protein